MNVAEVNSSFAFITSRLNSNQNSGAVNGTFTILSFGNDVTQLLDTLIDRPTAPRFRALINGIYRFSVKARTQFITGDAGGEIAVFKNTSTRLTEFNTVYQSTA